MRKILAAVSVLVTVLCLGAAVPARGAEVQAEGVFLAGSIETWGPAALSADTGGFYLAVGWRGKRQAGVEARLWDLEGDSVAAGGTVLGDTRVEAFRTDFLATGYILQKGGKISGFAGYSTSTRQLTSGTGAQKLITRASGLVAGVDLECPVTGNAALILSVAIRPGLEVEQKVQTLGEKGTIQGTGEGYDFAAGFRYAFNPGLALEAGYLNQTLGWRYGTQKPRKDVCSQFYAGACLNF